MARPSPPHHPHLPPGDDAWAVLAGKTLVGLLLFILISALARATLLSEENALKMLPPGMVLLLIVPLFVPLLMLQWPLRTHQRRYQPGPMLLTLVIFGTALVAFSWVNAQRPWWHLPTISACAAMTWFVLGRTPLPPWWAQPLLRLGGSRRPWPVNRAQGALALGLGVFFVALVYAAWFGNPALPHEAQIIYRQLTTAGALMVLWSRQWLLSARPRSTDFRITLARTALVIGTLWMMGHNLSYSWIQANSSIRVFNPFGIFGFLTATVLIVVGQLRDRGAHLPAIALTLIVGGISAAVVRNGMVAYSFMAVAGWALGTLTPQRHLRLAIGGGLVFLALPWVGPSFHPTAWLLHSLSSCVVFAVSSYWTRTLAGITLLTTRPWTPDQNAGWVDSRLSEEDEQPNRSAMHWGWLTAVVMGVLGLGSLYLHERNRQAQEEAVTQAVAQDKARQLANLLARGQYAAHALVPALDNNDHPSHAQYDAISRGLLHGMGDKVSLQWGPRAVLKYVAPLETNQAVVGLDLLHYPPQRAYIEALLERRQPLWTAPTELRQGGVGLLYRVPIFLDSSPESPLRSLSAILFKLPDSLTPVFQNPAVIPGDQRVYRAWIGPDAEHMHPVYSSPDPQRTVPAEGWRRSELALLPFERQSSQKTWGPTDGPRSLLLRVEASPPLDSAPNTTVWSQAVVLIALLCGWGTYQLIGQRAQWRQARHLRTELAITQQLLGASVTGQVLFKASGACVAANEAAAHLSDTPLAQLQTSDFRAWPFLQHDGIRAQARATLSDGRPRHATLEHDDGQGRLRSVVVHFSTLGLAGQTHLLLQLVDVSELRSQQKALEEAHSRLQTTMQAVNEVGVGVQWIDAATGRFLYTNRCSARMLGLSVEALLGMTVMDIAPGMTLEEFLDWSERIQAEGFLRFEHVQQRPDGRIHPVEVTSFYQGATDQQPAMLVTFVSDITERKQLENALQQKTEQLETIVQNAVIGIVSTQDRIIRWLNPGFCRISGYTEDELLGRSIRIIYPSDEFHEEMGRTIYPRVLQGQEVVQEIQIRHKDGRLIWVRTTHKADHPSAPHFQLITLVEDITEHKESEAHVRRLVAMIDLSSDFFSTARVDGTLTYINPAALRAMGLPADLAPGRLRLRDAHPSWAYRKLEQEAIPTVYAQGHWRGETALLGADGREIPVSQSLLLHRDEQGLPSYYSTILRDISGEKAAEQALIRAKEAAESANLAKSRFLATMSHELRTPLNAILGMAQLLLQNDLPAGERLHYARTILGSGKSLLALLTDILDYSKIEADRLVLQARPLQPRQVLEHLGTLYITLAQQQQLHLELGWAGPGNATYQGDALRLQQMLANLVSNALKFTPSGRIDVLGQELERADGQALLEFSVTDTGIGIDAEMQHQLFQPFIQVDNSMTRKHGGTGLGLAIVQRLAEAMGGSAGVQSRPGQGSRFWFRVRLPVAAEAQETAGAAGERLASGPALHGQVLLVEDNLQNQTVLTGYLRLLGLDWGVAATGQAALQMLDAGWSGDLVLLDLHLPDTDGFSVCERLRTLERQSGRRRAAVIAVSADVQDSTRARCQSVGMDDFLAKPVLFDEFQQVLTRWLPRPATEAPPTPRGLDSGAICAVLHTLMPLLAQHKFAAITQLEPLLPLTRGTAVEAEVEAARRDLEKMRFEAVAQRLRALARAQGWPLGR